MIGRPRVPLADRFWPKVAVGTDDECWEWLASRTLEGYGQIGEGGRGGRHLYAHRVSYELVVGPIPEDLQLDHLCRNTGCVNPRHLEPVTPKVNTNRGVRANSLKTHCPSGHPYDEQNTRVDRRGHRWCRACRAAYDRRRQLAAA